ncbi:hypothetical protein GGS20DRAFT_299168 [Poronia punctata]|nr:hypothetical protein GGS20DRAFT_299168 [Poronia punctata]
MYVWYICEQQVEQQTYLPYVHNQSPELDPHLNSWPAMILHVLYLHNTFYYFVTGEGKKLYTSRVMFIMVSLTHSYSILHFTTKES